MLKPGVAVVTGAGRGLGLAIARALAVAGKSVAMVDIDGLVESSAEALNADGLDCSPIVADITDPLAVDHLFASVEATMGPVDVLVNNAGRLVIKPLLEHSLADWDSVIATNLTAVFLCSQRCLVSMSSRRAGNIVNISSVAALGVTTTHVAYAASKAGVIALTRELAHEFAPLGIRVNAIAPGPIATPMTQHDVDEPLRQRLASSVPMGRWGQPGEIADAVVYLVSEHASFITGVTLVVAGGADLQIL